MGKTAQLNVNSSTYTAVPIGSVCRRITVYEDNQAGTTDYYVSATGSDSDRITKPAGTKKDFLADDHWIPNVSSAPGYLKTQAGSVTFAVENEGA